MLYKKGLESLFKEYEANKDGAQQRQIERELARTDGMTIDQSLNTFARDNSAILKQLVLLQCNDFTRPEIQKMLEDEDNFKNINVKQNKTESLNRLSTAKNVNSKHRGQLKKNLQTIKGITHRDTEEEEVHKIFDMITNRKGPFRPDADFEISPVKESPEKKIYPLHVGAQYQEMANYLSKTNEERKRMKDL